MRHAARPFRAALTTALLAGPLAAQAPARSPIGAPAASPGAAAARAEPLRYPAARRGDQVDAYHGVRVADPYRWLEDVDAPETRAWIAAENALTERYLAAVPQRAAIRERITALTNVPRYEAPIKEDGRYFSLENSGLQGQSVLYVRESLNGPAHVVLDPNALSADGTTSLGALGISRNARYVGYGVSRAGSDWQEVRVRDVGSGRDLADTLRWVKFTNIAWTRDNKGFYYSRYPAPDSATMRTAPAPSQALYYHRLGTAQASDRLAYARTDGAGWFVTGEVSDDGTYVVISARRGTDKGNRIFFIDLDDPKRPRVNAPAVRLVDAPDTQFQFVDNAGPVFYLRTDDEAPRGRVVAVSTEQPRRESWRTVIPEGRNAMTEARVVGEAIVVAYLEDAHSKVSVYDLGGIPKGDVELPGVGTVGALRGREDDRELFFTYGTFLAPPAVYRYDVQKRRLGVVRSAAPAADATRYETKQLFVTSRDGTRVPMFVTARVGVPLDGENPTLLSAYGGFGISRTPAFSAATLAWLERGGVYAVANVRGGGEYGREWHDAGTLARKQNVFDDFIAAAEQLVKGGYTRPARLAMQGGSNGGLLVGAVMAQRPDLFAAALPEVGVMDMLRYQRFTVGASWASEYGTADDSAQFRALYAYSPLQNLKGGTRYPATLVTTADHDDRVVPGHSLKFAATLQADQAGTAPVLLRVDADAGHGGGKPTGKRIAVQADELAFLVHVLGERLEVQ